MKWRNNTRKKEVKEIVKELSLKYYKNEEFIVLLVKICIDNEIKNIKSTIEKYLQVCQIGVSK